VNAKGGRPAKLGLTRLVGSTSRSSIGWTTKFISLGALQGRRKKPTCSGRGGERAAALSFQVLVVAPLGTVSKFPPRFGPAEPGLGSAHGSIGDALSL
jgi:hypothetical protein